MAGNAGLIKAGGAVIELMLDKTSALQGMREFEARFRQMQRALGRIGGAMNFGAGVERSFSRAMIRGLQAAFSANAYESAFNALANGLGTAIRRVFNGQFFAAMSNGFREAGRGLVVSGLAATLVFGKLSGLITQSLTAFSRQQQLAGRFTQVFKDLERDANSFAETLSGDVLQSVTELRDEMATFQAVLLGAGFAPQDAMELSKMLTETTQDMLAFDDSIADSAEAMDKLLSGMAGMVKPVERFGADIRKSAIDEAFEKMSGDMEKVSTRATQQERILARLGIIFEALGRSGAIGQARREAGLLASVLRGLKGATEMAFSSIGKALEPIGTKVVLAFILAANAIERFAEASPGLVQAGAALLVSLTALAGVMTATGVLFVIVGANLKALAGAMSAATAPIRVFAGVMGALVNIAAGFNAVVNATVDAMLGIAKAGGAVGVAAKNVVTMGIALAGLGKAATRALAGGIAQAVAQTVSYFGLLGSTAISSLRALDMPLKRLYISLVQLHDAVRVLAMFTLAVVERSVATSVAANTRAIGASTKLIGQSFSTMSAGAAKGSSVISTGLAKLRIGFGQAATGLAAMGGALSRGVVDYPLRLLTNWKRLTVQMNLLPVALRSTSTAMVAINATTSRALVQVFSITKIGEKAATGSARAITSSSRLMLTSVSSAISTTTSRALVQVFSITKIGEKAATGTARTIGASSRALLQTVSSAITTTTSRALVQVFSITKIGEKAASGTARAASGALRRLMQSVSAGVAGTAGRALVQVFGLSRFGEKALGGVARAAGKSAASVYDAIAKLGDVLIDRVVKALDLVLKNIANVAKVAVKGLAQVGAVLGSGLLKGLGVISGFLVTLGGVAGSTLGFIATSFASVLAPVLAIGVALGLLTVVFVRMKPYVESVFSAIFGAGGALSSLFDTLKSVGGTAFSALMSGFQTLLADGKAAFKGLSDAIRAGDLSLAFSIAWSFIKLEFYKGYAAIAASWDEWRTYLLTVGNDLWTALQVLFSDGFIELQVLADMFVQTFGGAWEMLVGWIKPLWEGFLEWFSGMTNSTGGEWNALWDSSQSTVLQVVDLIKDAFDVTVNYLISVWDGFIGILEKAWALARSLVDSTVDYESEAARIDKANAAASAQRENEMGQRILDRENERKQKSKEIEDQKAAKEKEIRDKAVEAQKKIDGARNNAQVDSARKLQEQQQDFKDKLQQAEDAAREKGDRTMGQAVMEGFRGKMDEIQSRLGMGEEAKAVSRANSAAFADVAAFGLGVPDVQKDQLKELRQLRRIAERQERKPAAKAGGVGK